MTREQAETLVNALTTAATAYFRATPGQDMFDTGQEFRRAREAVIYALHMPNPALDKAMRDMLANGTGYVMAMPDGDVKYISPSEMRDE